MIASNRSVFVVGKRRMTPDEVRAAVGVDCSSDESLVKQEFKDDADINLIMARCLRTGSDISYVNRVAPAFVDASVIPDFRGCLDRIKAAEDAFMLLPATVRREFNNEPARMLEFLANRDNDERAIKLGLRVAPKPVVPATPAPPAPQPAVIPPGK